MYALSEDQTLNEMLIEYCSKFEVRYVCRFKDIHFFETRNGNYSLTVEEISSKIK